MYVTLVGIPKVHWAGTEGDLNVLVMDLLGSTLETLFDSCNRKFSLKTVLMIADQMVSRFFIDRCHDSSLSIRWALFTET